MNTIKIDVERQIGALSRDVFGGFAEHLGRCIYGGMFDEGSPLADEHGFRKDVLAVLKRLRLPVIRLSGREFSSPATAGRTAWARATSARRGWSWPGSTWNPIALAPTSSCSTAARWAPSPTWR